MNSTAQILDVLTQIRGTIYFVGLLALVWVVLACVRTYYVLKREVRSAFANIFRDEAETLLEKGQGEELAKLARGKLAERPNHVLAHWYLARSFYMREEWPAALAEFEATRRLHPAWNHEHIAPFVAEIQRRLETPPVPQ